MVYRNPMITRRVLLATAAPLLAQSAPLKIAVVGTEHGHVRGFLNAAKKRPDVEILGPLPLTAKAEIAKAECIACFTSTFDHLAVTRLAAELKLPMMMEKPLAVSLEHAREIATLASRAAIPVFVNYETTWYRSHAELKRNFSPDTIRKMVAMDGHQGPREIGVQDEFFAWLTDPIKNGAGALFDFGCYGANLMTWMMNNERPLTVTARVKTNKPAIYPKVDDEATILVEYPKAQGIIQGSWNWPFARKDFEVYGEKAYAQAIGGNLVRHRPPAAKAEETLTPPELPADDADSISYLKSIVRGKRQPGGLSSLENNLIATEILVAARDSAKSGRTITLARSR